MGPSVRHDLRIKDLRHLWHPFTDIRTLEREDFPIIERGNGIYLYDVDGREYIDGISSWWGCNLGHNHPTLVSAIQLQATILQHSILGGMGHPSAILLAEKLASIAPPGLTRTAFACDGSSAVEMALKMALQYWQNRALPEKCRFISLQNGYHGDTLGAMGVGFIPPFHAAYRNCISEPIQTVGPDSPVFLSSIEECIEDHANEVAGLILEPLCQAAGGMHIYPESYLQRIRELCDTHGILLIADEIAVGFGRVGSYFACGKALITPDILCLGKAITAGYLPLSATMTTEDIFETFREKPFFHSHTFAGNPIAASVALAALKVYESEKIIESIPEKERVLQAALEQLPFASSIRTLGCIGAFNVETPEVAKRIAHRAKDNGLLIRPLGNVVYLWPPLISTHEQLEEMVSILRTAYKIEC